MTETGRHRGDCFSRVEEKRRLQVAKVVQARLDAELPAETTPGPGRSGSAEAARRFRVTSGTRSRRQSPASRIGQLGERSECLRRSSAVSGSRPTQRTPWFLVSRNDPLPLDVEHAPPDHDPGRRPVDIDRGPLEPADLTSPAPGDGDETEHHSVHRVPGCGSRVEDAEDIGDHRRHRLDLLDARWCGPLDRVAIEPTPAHGLGEGGPQDTVVAQDRCRLAGRRLGEQAIQVVENLGRDFGQRLARNPSGSCRTNRRYP